MDKMLPGDELFQWHGMHLRYGLRAQERPPLQELSSKIVCAHYYSFFSCYASGSIKIFFLTGGEKEKRHFARLGGPNQELIDFFNRYEDVLNEPKQAEIEYSKYEVDIYGLIGNISFLFLFSQFPLCGRASALTKID